MLAHLFQKSLNCETVPNDWKKAYVTSIYKKDNKSSPIYHSISLTSVMCKVMEHILVSHIMHHLEAHNILTPNLALDLNIPVSHSYSSQLQTLL